MNSPQDPVVIADARTYAARNTPSMLVIMLRESPQCLFGLYSKSAITDAWRRERRNGNIVELQRGTNASRLERLSGSPVECSIIQLAEGPFTGQRFIVDDRKLAAARLRALAHHA